MQNVDFRIDSVRFVCHGVFLVRVTDGLMEVLPARSNKEFGGLEIANDPSPVLNGKHCEGDGKWRKCRAQFIVGSGILHIHFKRQRWTIRRGKLRSSKTIKELIPNKFAVIYLRNYGHDTLDYHSLAIVPLQMGCVEPVSILSSQSVSEIKYLGQKLQDFCNVLTYKVEVKNSIAFSGPAFLHILEDSIILSELREFKFVCCGQWPIRDCNQLEQCDNGLLFRTDEGCVYLIHTSQNSEICDEFLKRLCILKSSISTFIPNESTTTTQINNLTKTEEAPPIPGPKNSSENSSQPSKKPPVPPRCPIIRIQSSSSSEYGDSDSGDTYDRTIIEETGNSPEKPPKRPPKPQTINEKANCVDPASDIGKRTHYLLSPPNNHFYKNQRHHSDSEMHLYYNRTENSKYRTEKRRKSLPNIEIHKNHCSAPCSISGLPRTIDDSLTPKQSKTSSKDTNVQSRCYVYTNLQHTQQQYANVFIEVNNLSYVNWNPGELKIGPDRPPPIVPPRKPCPPVPPRTRGSKPRNSERCQFAASSEHKEVPSVYVAVFASQPVAGRTWFLRVAFIHKDDTTWKTFQELEEGSNHELKKIQDLEVKDDIQVALEIPSEFELSSKTCIRDIDLESVKSLEKGKGFVIEFCVLDKITDRAHEFLGKIIVEPKDKSCCLLTNRIEMGINQVFERKEGYMLPALSSAALPDYSSSQSSLSLNFSQRLLICQKLDMTLNPLGHDWRLVASKLNFTNNEILHLEDLSHKCHTFSPMKYVLNTWEQRDQNCSVSRLLEVLREIERPDIIEDINSLSQPANNSVGNV